MHRGIRPLCGESDPETTLPAFVLETTHGIPLRMVSASEGRAIESKVRKEMEARLLAQRNAEMRRNLAATGAATDMDITDEATGAARVRVAAESKANKEAEARRLASENATMRRTNAKTALRTDADISDEAAGAARLEKAIASKARKEMEARVLASQNAAMRRKVAVTGAATDFDISDEAAGEARLKMAAASKARKEAEARRLASENAAMRRTNAKTALRTDADISDEAAGRARLMLAAESKALREEDARMISQRNAEMRRRIKSTTARTEHRKGSTSHRGGATPQRPVSAPGRQDEVQKANRTAQRKSDDEKAELKLLRAMIERTNVAEKKEGGWNTAPYRPVPYALRGVRPMHTYEPWGKDVILQSRKTGMMAGTVYATATLKRLDDGMYDSVAQLHRRRAVEDAQLSEVTGRPAWDPTQWRYCPAALTGLKPVTSEPWSRDLEVYLEGEVRIT